MGSEQEVISALLDAYKADRGCEYPVLEKAGYTMRVRSREEVRALVERAVHNELFGEP